MITLEQWQQAQLVERAWWDKHHWDRDRFAAHYQGYFDWLGIDKDCKGKKILEIGPADLPALSFCSNVQGIILEPMPSESLKKVCEERGFLLETEMAETFDFPDVGEIWIFNVLQHVLDPGDIIENCLMSAKCIRFFEPIDWGTDRMHLHNLTMDFFRQYFNNVRRFDKPDFNVLFHTHPCAYGVNYV